MRKPIALVLIAALLSAVAPGCATNEGLREHQGAAVGAGAGAVGGAVIGGLVGGRRGAVVGGLLGALTGGVVGNYYDEKEKSLAETRRAHADYSAAKGTRLRIERLRASPATAAPGETVDIQMTYAVLTPREDVMVPVKETREILFNGSRVGETTVDIEREGGTWRSIVPITLPRNARPGSYRVVASVASHGGGKDTEEITFRVR
ncbi:MAG: glycine zipper domain-containing protein [Verrucomicrobiota bacterium]